MILLLIPIILIVLAPLFLLSGLIWMLGLGALAHIFNEPRLAIDYWNSVLVAVIVWLLIGGGIRSSR